MEIRFSYILVCCGRRLSLTWMAHCLNPQWKLLYPGSCRLRFHMLSGWDPLARISHSENGQCTLGYEQLTVHLFSEPFNEIRTHFLVCRNIARRVCLCYCCQRLLYIFFIVLTLRRWKKPRTFLVNNKLLRAIIFGSQLSCFIFLVGNIIMWAYCKDCVIICAGTVEVTLQLLKCLVVYAVINHFRFHLIDIVWWKAWVAESCAAM